MKDFFDVIAPKIGVTAKEFQHLSGDQVLIKYFNGLEKANLSQKQMSFFLESIAGDATALIPLLRNNAEGWENLATAAHKTGQVMKDSTVFQLAAASGKIGQFTNGVTILAGEILTKLIPAFEILKNGLGFIGEIIAANIIQFDNFGNYLGALIESVISPAQKAFHGLTQSVQGLRLALDGEFRAAAALIIQSKETMLEAGAEIKEIPGRLGEAFMKFAGETMEVWGDLGDNLEQRAENIETAWAEMWGNLQDTSTETAKSVVKSSKKIETAFTWQTDEIDKTTKAYKDAAKAAKKYADEAEKAAERAIKAQRQANNQSINSGYDGDLDAKYSAEYKYQLGKGVSPDIAKSLAVSNVNARERRGGNQDGETSGDESKSREKQNEDYNQPGDVIGSGSVFRSGLTSDSSAQASNSLNRAQTSGAGQRAFRGGYSGFQNPDGSWTSIQSNDPSVALGIPGRGVDLLFATNVAIRQFNERHKQGDRVPFANTENDIQNISRMMQAIQERLA